MEYTVIHDDKVSRFEILESGQIAYLQYMLLHNTMDIIHTFVPVMLEGQGIGSALAKVALDYARENQFRVRPSCSFIDVYMQRHREYEDLRV